MGETRQLGEDLLPKKGWRGFVARYLFPTICGLIVTSFGGYCATQLDRLTKLEDELANYQRDHEVLVRWMQSELNTLLAEEAATNKLQTQQQIEIGILDHKVHWALGQRSEPGANPVMGTGPTSPSFDLEELAKLLAGRVGKTAKVSPEDLNRLRTDQRPVSHEPPSPVKKG